MKNLIIFATAFIISVMYYDWFELFSLKETIIAGIITGIITVIAFKFDKK